MGTSVRRTIPAAFVVGVLLLAAACSVSTQEPSSGPTTPATVTTAARSSPGDGTPTTDTGPGTATPPPTASLPTPGTNTPAPLASVPASLVGHVVSRLPTRRKVVALTFDAGANGDGVDSILSTLAKEKVAATFYLTGSFVDSFPTLAVRMSAAGRLGNHSTTHPHLPTLTDSEVRNQITGAQTTILRITGEDPRPLFRFPFGDSGQRDLRLVNDLGYIAVGWTVDTLGWQGTSGGRSLDSVVQRVLAAETPGEIVLMHVGSHPTDHSTLDADALPRVISGLRSAGYGFVTLDALGTG